MSLTNGFKSWPYTNTWVGKTEVSLCHYIHVVYIGPQNSFELEPNQITYAVYQLDWLG